VSDDTQLAFGAILEKRFSRRTLLGAAGSLVAVGSVAPVAPLAAIASGAELKRPAGFVPVAPQTTDSVVLPKEYTYDVIARWGDSLFPGTPSLTAADLRGGRLLSAGAADRQARQFGANCDAVAYFSNSESPRSKGRSDGGVLCVNNEYVAPALMFSGRRRSETAEERRLWSRKNPQAIDVMKAAHGVSIIEVSRRRGAWQRHAGAPLTRRITAETLCEITGPARGAALLRTKEDPDGVRVRGTFANCAGGKTPWGTYLTAEENIDDYFGSGQVGVAASKDPALAEAHRRFALRDRSLYGWDHVDPRFDARHEPREALRFGWIVEIDPRDPSFVPRKRTALGRFSHEGANSKLAADGRVAVYMGDDDMFEYVYKFVTRDRFDSAHPAANRDLLDTGTLCVARFDADGTGEWLPLVWDEKGPLNRRAGFENQADVVIKARAAADLLGATPMDRPEDVEPSPATGRVYIACTKNKERVDGSLRAERSGRDIDIGINAANPRPLNEFGHVIELIEEDAADRRFRWNVFLLAGDPGVPGSTFISRYEDIAQTRLFAADTYYAGHGDAAGVSALACPDNLGIDPFGRLWIVTDTDDKRLAHNGCYVCPTDGPERGKLTQLMSAPAGAEVCGCEFTPDGTTLFLSIQHPGEGGTIDEPGSHWPDGNDQPPRSALIAVRRRDGLPV
jgi:secreted PhoX family phosphatase